MSLNRRSVLKGVVVSAAAAGLPSISQAQTEPIKVGILTPLTGAGGNDGPRMLKAMQAVFEEVNKAGGVMGRRIDTVVEDPGKSIARRSSESSGASVPGVTTTELRTPTASACGWSSRSRRTGAPPRPGRHAPPAR